MKATGWFEDVGAGREDGVPVEFLTEVIWSPLTLLGIDDLCSAVDGVSEITGDGVGTIV